MSTSVRPPTLHDVAERAGVSHTTVSRVINGGAKVATSTARRVEQAIAALDYRLDTSAQALAYRRRQVRSPSPLTGRGAGVDPARPGGEEWTIAGHGYQASILAVGATLRRLTHDGIDLIVSFPAEQMRPLYRGAICAPWPNRIANGRYRYNGQTQQLPLNEVDRGNALHGLVLWSTWRAVHVDPTRLTLTYDLPAQPGYPHTLTFDVTYQIGTDGLTTTLTCLNTSSTAVPYGCCPHPYLRLAHGQMDDWTLTVPAATRLEVDHNLRPTRPAPAADSDCDFRRGQCLTNRKIDHAFTDIEFDAHGTATASITDSAGRGVAITWTGWAPWIQVHTADRPEPDNDRVGVALEPMSCPPDAFNSPAGPPLLPRGETHTAVWTIGALVQQF